VVGLMLVATGGAIVQIRLFQILAGRRTGLLAPIFAEVRKAPFLLAVLHVIIYGAFFMAMALGLRSPFAFLMVEDLVTSAFREGDLAYIGAAYASGNIPLAMATTFFHNYFVATVGLTLLPSLIIPFAGVLKTLGTFAMVGFAMAPIYTGTAAGMVYHSITMTLELEAYIIAAFAVTMYPIRFVTGFARSGSLMGALDGLKVMGSAIVLTGVMLAIAAAYEAVTLIMLR